VIAATILLTAAKIPARTPLRLLAKSALLSQSQATLQTPNAGTGILLRWGARPGVSRYRLQLARDAAFTDIVFDLVVNGNAYQLTELTPGRYFWRIAALTTKLGEFSSPAIVEVTAGGYPSNVPPSRSDNRRAGPTTGKNLSSESSIVAGNGWRAAVGDIPRPTLAHLRSRGSFDIVGVNTEGVTFALEAATGIALWSLRPLAQKLNAPPIMVTPIAPVLIQSRNGLDNLIVFSGSTAVALEGSTGHELWRAALPAPAASGLALSDNRSAEIFILDNSLRGLFVLNANNGSLVAKTQLALRVVGGPVLFDYQGTRGVMLAYEDGRVEIRDKMGAVVRSGDAASPNTTPPLFVSGSRGGLILVGTRSGLTALSADDLRALGRVTLKDTVPHGILASADLDMDGNAEVIMFTNQGRVVALNASDGKILWQANGPDDAESVAFADVNGDRIVDVVMTGRQAFAFALSGRDGSVLWKQEEQPAVVANHAASLAPRSIVAVPSGSGVLLVASDLFHTGLRAIEIRKATLPQSSH